MKNTTKLLIIFAVTLGSLAYFFVPSRADLMSNKVTNETFSMPTPTPSPHPLDNSNVANFEAPDAKFLIEQELGDNGIYKSYIASYSSTGHTVYGLLTIPNSQDPNAKFPIIMFNHGYIPPLEYPTVGKYVAYQDSLAAAGYITYKSDYSGHGRSEGSPSGTYFSNQYVYDVLAALEAANKLPQADPSRVGIWGHSMGGFITQKIIYNKPRLAKAAVIWGGVVGSYKNVFDNFFNRRTRPPDVAPSQAVRFTSVRSQILATHGTPDISHPFWRSVDATVNVSSLVTPILLIHTLGDETVPYKVARGAAAELAAAGRAHSLIEYEGDNHNINANFGAAMGETIKYFDKYLK